MPDPVLSLIVVTHNSARWLPGFFRTWRQCAAGSSAPIHLILADAGSTDDTLAVARTTEPTCDILLCGNIGYGAAANRAAAKSTAPWRLLCNPDLLFPTDFLTRFLLPAMDLPAGAWGCIAPTLLNQDGSRQPSVGRFPTLGDLLRDQFRPRLHRKYLPTDRIHEGSIDWAAGACLFCSRDAWDAVSGFDERFFLYVEEVDLQRRLADRGLRTHYLPAAHVIHAAPNASGAPRSAIQRYAARGLLRYFAKHGTGSQLMGYRCLAVASRRLPFAEAFASREKILATPTGP